MGGPSGHFAARLTFRGGSFGGVFDDRGNDRLSRAVLRRGLRFGSDFRWRGLRWSGSRERRQRDNAGFLTAILTFLAIAVLVILIKNTNPRFKIDHALRFFWFILGALGITAVILASVRL